MAARPILGIGLFVTLTLLLASAAGAGDVFTFPHLKEVAITGKPVLNLSNPSGSITISSHPDKVIKIQAHKKVKAKDAEEAKKIAEHIEIEVTSQGETVNVKTDFEDFKKENFWDFLFGQKLSHSAWVDYQVWVPEDCQLGISATSADINVSNIKSQVGISCTSGDIQLKEINGNLEISATSGDMILTGIKGAASISVTSGDLRLDGLEGTLDYQSSSGDVKAENIQGGEIRIQTSSGDIRLSKVSGEIEMEGSSSDIIVDQTEGSLSAHTTSGDILAKSEKLNGKSYSLETSSGDIKFSLPGHQGGRLELETVSGTIRANLPMTVELVSEHKLSGYINKAGPEIYIHTTSGDVLLTQY